MNFYHYKGMVANGNTQDRPEELLCYEIIRTHLRGLLNIDKQKIVWFNDINHAKLDVEFSIRSGQKYALRMQGPYHGMNDRVWNHDKMQIAYLQEKGYIVIDFWYKHMPNLWMRNEKILELAELKLAFVEIKTKLKTFGLLLKTFTPGIINQEQLTREYNNSNLK